MNRSGLLLLLPLMTAGCHLFKIGKGKNMYVSPSQQMLQVHAENYDKVYVIRNVDIKALACLSKILNSTLEIDGVPEFSRAEVSRLCEIPDYCLKKIEPKPYEIRDTDAPEVISAEI